MIKSKVSLPSNSMAWSQSVLFGAVFLHLYALLTVSLVLDLSSRLICSQDICSQSALICLPVLSQVINSLLMWHVTELGLLSGIAAILRFPISDPDDNDEENGANSSSDTDWHFTAAFSVSNGTC